MTGRFLMITVFAVAIIAGCKSTDQTTTDGADGPVFEVDGEIAEEYLMEELNETERTLYRTRTTLDDRFASIRHDMPEIFLKEAVQQEIEFNPYAGFRVQILSTRDIEEADSTRDYFMSWAGEQFYEISPEAYVIFRQPTYRVRVGDFRDRNRAITFSRLLKQNWPEAWVVHDRIVPEDVPLDSLEIKFTSPPDTLSFSVPDSLAAN